MDAALVTRIWGQLGGTGPADVGADLPLHARHVGISVLRAGPDGLELRWLPGPALSNPIGIVHGGYTALVLDDAAALACATCRGEFQPMSTVDLRIDFLGAVRPGLEYRARGAVLHTGRRRLVAEAAVLDPDGRMAARAVGCFMPNQAVAAGRTGRTG